MFTKYHEHKRNTNKHHIFTFKEFMTNVNKRGKEYYQLVVTLQNCLKYAPKGPRDWEMFIWDIQDILTELKLPLEGKNCATCQ